MKLNKARKNEIDPFIGIKPVREGAYRTWLRNDDRLYYQWWNGKFWGVSQDSPEEAEQMEKRGGVSIWQNPGWFGLKKK